MKKIIFLGLIILLIIGSCTQEKKSTIEGGWQLVSVKSSSGETFPGNWTGTDVKMWTKDCFVFAGKFQQDTITFDNFGWGKYTLQGNKYEEEILFHQLDPSSIGKKIKMLVEVRNDTLVQQWPADENWKLPEKFDTEKYVRLK